MLAVVRLRKVRSYPFQLINIRKILQNNGDEGGETREGSRRAKRSNSDIKVNSCVEQLRGTFGVNLDAHNILPSICTTTLEARKCMRGCVSTLNETMKGLMLTSLKYVRPIITAAVYVCFIDLEHRGQATLTQDGKMH